MIKAVFFDIDGTLANKKGAILPSSIEAIQQLQQNGVICGIATGRGPADIHKYLNYQGFDVYVTYNGQLIYTHEKDLYQQVFDSAILKQIVKLAQEKSYPLLFGGRDRVEGHKVMMLGQKPWIRRLVNYVPRNLPIHKVKHLFPSNRKKSAFDYTRLALYSQPIFQCVLLCSDPDLSLLEAQLPTCHLTRSSAQTIDIIPNGGSKLVGIQLAGKEFGFSLDEVMAFGDGWNDKEMLQGVKLGIAMGNGEEHIQQLADYVTDTNERDGVAKALKHYKLI